VSGSELSHSIAPSSGGIRVVEWINLDTKSITSPHDDLRSAQ
jgi:hypothetical protein